MERETLKELGLDKDVIEKIMAAHGQTVNEIKQERDNLKADLETEKQSVQTLQNDLKERNDQLETLKNDHANVSGLQEQINLLKADNDKKESEFKKQREAMKKDYEIELALINAKARSTLSVMAHIDKDAVTFDDDGNLTGLKEQIDRVKETDAYLFNPDDGDGTGAASGTGSGNGDYVPGSTQTGNGGKDVTDEERGKALAEKIWGESQ